MYDKRKMQEYEINPQYGSVQIIDDGKGVWGMRTKSGRIKCIAFLAVFFLMVCLCRSCCGIFINTEEEIFISPRETNTIIVQYDFVCRPTVYKKAWIGKEKIWTYPGSGFMETVHFGVEWLSEDQIRMSYDDENDEYDEEFIITIP